MHSQSPDTWWVIHFHFKSTGPCQRGNSGRATLNVRPHRLHCQDWRQIDTERRVKQQPVGGDPQVWSSHVLSRKKWADHVLLLERWAVSCQQLEVAGGTDRQMAGGRGNGRQKRWAAVSVFAHPLSVESPALHYGADRWHQAPQPLQSIPRTHMHTPQRSVVPITYGCAVGM